MKDQELDKLFSDGLKDQEITPPASVWQGIENNLEAEKIVPLKKKNNLQVWFIAASVLLALGISSKLFLFQENEDSAQPSNIAEHKPAIIPEEPIESQQEQASAEISKVESNSEASNTVKPQNQIASSKTPIQVKSDIEGNIKTVDPEKTSSKKDEPNLVLTPMEEMKVLSNIQLEEVDQEKQVEMAAAEVAPIQPLVNIIEQEELMYAEAKKQPKKKQTILTNILNTLSENLNPSNKPVKFNSDEEGTITVDLFNSIAKTRR
ncbi:hypothetical protein [Sphingobacterium cellulitidis]|uniref:hypothetical protein n=1 Tax=Sphingobacterium cellulitidis TaxID=1768011 RepID=UPI003C7B9831